MWFLPPICQQDVLILFMFLEQHVTWKKKRQELVLSVVNVLFIDCEMNIILEADSGTGNALVF